MKYLDKFLCWPCSNLPVKQSSIVKINGKNALVVTPCIKQNKPCRCCSHRVRHCWEVRSVRGTVGLGNTITGQKNCFYTLKISIVTLLIKVDLALPVLNTVSWPTVNLMWNEVCETCHITRSNLIWLCCCFYAHDVSRACMSGLAQHLRFADPTCPHRGTKISKRSQLIMQTSREIIELFLWRTFQSPRLSPICRVIRFAIQYRRNGIFCVGWRWYPI